jgi:Na+/proline symporter
MLVFDWTKDNHFLKQLVSGAFIALAMTGLDQDMMQKNLTCPTRRSAQKNMALVCVILVIVNFGFLYLGGALYAFGARTGFVSLTGDPSFPISMLDPLNNTMVPRLTDELFAYMALDYMSVPIATAFILGLIAAAYSSADSALTGLTTSFCVDVLGFSRKPSSPGNQRTRMLVQTGFALLLFLVILIFKGISSPAVISSIFKAAGFTYGPLLGFFAFGLLLPRCRIPDRATPVAAIISVTATWFINREFSQSIGFLILPINGMITFMLLFLLHLISRFRPQSHA